ncbi:MAG: helix-turn-helix transcriptional regulator, partial [Rhizobiaceae bacterium]
MNDETRHRAFDPALRAEIIDRLYDVALDPVRYEELVDVWEGGISPLRLSAEGARLSDADMENHFKRASVFLDRFEVSHRLSGYQAALSDVGRSAAFVSDGKRVVAANDQAGLVFALHGGESCAVLPFAPEDQAALQSTVRRIIGGRDEKAATLRIRDQRSGKLEILRIMPVKDADGRPFALVTSSAVTWPDDFSVTLADAFELTDAEIEIVRGIVEGLGVRDIARERARSEHTVRTQLRHVLSKTETHSQSELVRIMLGLMDLTATRGVARPAGGADGRLAPIVPKTMRLADGRRLSWIEFGAPAGRPLLYLHMSYGLARWPADAEAQALQRNIRVIVPIRAGYGGSDPQPAVDDYCGRNTNDIGQLIDRLGVPRLAILTLGADLRYG